jgi:hypothetical protein
MARPITEQIRELTPEQKDTALLCLALRSNRDDWQRALELANELHPQEKAS